MLPRSAGRPPPAGENLDLGKQIPGGVLVELLKRRLLQIVLDPMHVKEAELDISKIRPVMRHRLCPPFRPDPCPRARHASPRLLQIHSNLSDASREGTFGR